MTFHRLIRAGDELRSVGRIASISERGPNEILVVAFETHDADGSLVTTQDVVCVSRGTAPGRGSTRPVMKKNGRSRQESTEPLARRTVSLPDDITFRYAKASGDDNRIHIDEDFARRMGLPGIVVQGMCLFAIAVQVVVGGPCREDRLG